MNNINDVQLSYIEVTILSDRYEKKNHSKEMNNSSDKTVKPKKINTIIIKY